MKFAFSKNSRKLICGALLAISCLGLAAVGFAEAKAYDQGSVLRGNYVHTMQNEFFQRGANMYCSYNPSCAWGEITAREESGYDGSVKRCWLIGDLKQVGNNYALQVKRHVLQKLDNRGNIQMDKIDVVNYTINLYHRMENGFKAEWTKKGQGPCADIDGEYITAMEYPLMSSEAAMYVLGRFMNSIPRYQQILQGAAMFHIGDKLAEKHTIKIIEHHPDHIVTRGTYYITAAGTIAEYDVITDSWKQLVQ